VTTQQHKTTHTADSSHVDVDAVVREVLRRLQSNRPLANEATVQSARPATPPSVDPSDLQLSHRVVTLDDLSGRLEAVQTLTVPVGAVVTPAARDALKENSIVLRHADKPSREASQAVSSLIVASAATAMRTSRFLQTLGSLGTKIDSIESTELSDAVSQLVATVGEHDRLGLLLTDKSALAACMANRDGRARAAVVRSLEDVTQAVESLGANVLIVEPQMTSMHLLRSMVAAFVRSSARSCPAVLANQTSQEKRCACSSAK